MNYSSLASEYLVWVCESLKETISQDTSEAPGSCLPRYLSPPRREFPLGEEQAIPVMYYEIRKIGRIEAT
jgi:hypothetical protein